MAESNPEGPEILLEARVRNLVRDVGLAKTTLGQIEPRLRRRVEVRLGTEIARRRRDVDELRQTVTAGEIPPVNPWADLHALEFEVDALIEECLGLLHGATLRKLQLDGGYCDLADALVDELVARTPAGCWSSFTVLGRSEDYSRTTRVIRIRFPGASLWDLPVAAHELGHFVGPLLVNDRGMRMEHPLETLYGQVGSNNNERAWQWLQELFADAFAAYMVGPAYGFTSVALGFDPVRAYLPDETHPPAVVRVRAIVGALRALDAHDMEWAAKHVETLWAGLVEASEAVTVGGDAEAVGGWIPELGNLLVDHLPVSGYAGWSEAQRLVTGLSGDAGGAQVEGATTLPDVLNAAWLARLSTQNHATVDSIELRARKMCEEVMEERG